MCFLMNTEMICVYISMRRDEQKRIKIRMESKYEIVKRSN